MLTLGFSTNEHATQRVISPLHSAREAVHKLLALLIGEYSYQSLNHRRIKLGADTAS